MPLLEPERTKPGQPPAVLLRVKVVPGAKRDGIAGKLGERLKIRVSQPPEGGKANRAVCELIAEKLNIKVSAVTVVAGASSPEKTLRVEGVSVIAASAGLAGDT